MDLEPRATAPAHATGAVEFVPLAAISDDVAFRLREEGDVSVLASSIGRLGQLTPVELRPLPGAAPGGPRWQVVAGFRRLAALRLLMRERVLARVHQRLDDDDAWGLALGQALLTEPLSEEELFALRERLAAEGIAPWAQEPEAPLEDEASPDLAPAAGPPQEETVEITPEALAEDLASRLNEVNQDLALAFDSWKDLPPESRRLVLEQARYVAELFPYLDREDD